jgi:hypothetical protein
MNMIFCSPEHRAFYFAMLEKAGVNDNYHRALFYTIGITADSRKHIEDLFDFPEDCIRPDGLEKAWQTGGTMKLTRLAFNLWNGFSEEGRERLTTPEELFCCSYAPCFYEAVKLRYPEYCQDISRTPPNHDVR